MPVYTSDDIALGIIVEGRVARTDGPSYLHHPVMSERGIIIALATALVESGLKMYANHADPASLQYPHDAIGYDANSVGVFQQRAEWWGTASDRMDVRRSAAMFYNRLANLDYNNPRNTPGSQAQAVQRSAYPDRYDQYIPQATEIYQRLSGGRTEKMSMIEKVLPYDRALVPQETGWWCGPASTQTVLQSQGIRIPESQIANDIEQIENPGRGDDRDGTDYVGLIEIYLDRKVPQAKYTSVYMQNDPPTRDQIERLWRDVKKSIDAGWGVVANIVAPPNNPPAATNGDVPPPYPRSVTTYHYVAIMGYAEGSGMRAVKIADSANFGGILGWWCPLEGRGSISSLIPPKGYCYANVDTAPPPPPVVKPPAPPADKPADPMEALQAKIDRLTDALVTLLGIIEQRHPEILRDYIQATKG